MKGLVQGLSAGMTGGQRRSLRALAHHRKPVVMVGTNGVSEGVLHSLDEALERHELVKVKLQGGFEGEMSDAARLLSEGTGSALVQQIGGILLFYRQRKKDSRIYFRAGKLVVVEDED